MSRTNYTEGYIVWLGPFRSSIASEEWPPFSAMIARTPGGK